MKQRHLRGPGWRRSLVAACGVRNPERSTTDPTQVTCKKCKRTLLMADMEARQSLVEKQRRFPRGNRRSNP